MYDDCREVYVDDVKTGMGGATGNKVKIIFYVPKRPFMHLTVCC